LPAGFTAENYGIELLFSSSMTRLSKIFSAHDYVIGAWLILMPWLLSFGHHGVPTLFSVITGCGIIVYNLFTNYQFGLIKFIPDPVHHLVDFLTGLFLCAAPWLFNYQDEVLWPHLGTGVLCLALTMFTNRSMSRRHFTNIIKRNQYGQHDSKYAE
jgi:hypothetical protein